MTTFRMLIGPDEGADAFQLAFRAILLFAIGIIYIRIAGRRTFGQYTPLDILVALIVGSNISRIVTGKAAFFPALAATLVLVILHRVLAHASMRWKMVTWLVKAPAIRIIEKGKIDKDRMRRAELGREDLLEALRMKQIDDPAEVELATLEAGGKLSVIPMKTLRPDDLAAVKTAMGNPPDRGC